MKLLTSHLRIATPSPRGKLHFYLRALNSGQQDYSVGWLHRCIRVLHFFHSLQPDTSFKAPKQIPRNLKPTPKQTFSPPTLLLHSASGSKKYQNKLASTSTQISCHKGKVSGKYFVQILLGILTIHNLAIFIAEQQQEPYPKQRIWQPLPGLTPAVYFTTHLKTSLSLSCLLQPTPTAEFLSCKPATFQPPCLSQRNSDLIVFERDFYHQVREEG